MLGIFKRKPAPAHPDARVHVVQIKGGLQLRPSAAVLASTLRRRQTTLAAHEQTPKRGMWVRYQDRTGIVTEFHKDDTVTVMLTDDDAGLNALEIHCLASELRQAWYEEIPWDRRPEYAHAASLGYHLKDSV